MKKLAAAIAAIAVFTASSVAMAGIVLVQKEQVTGTGQPQSTERTLMIQGNKEKMVSGTHQVITDLDKGTMYIIYPSRKVYVEMPFPPTGPMAKMMGKPAFHGAQFKKTGKSRTVAGFKCQEYTGSGKFESGEYTINECVSANVPGAAEFLAFEANMVKKLKGSAYDMSSEHPMPHGVPLAQDASTRLTKIAIPNLPPKEAEKLQQEIKNHPPIVSRVEVEKISVENLPASTFEVPAGFQKQEFGMFHGGAPQGAPAPKQ
jgi:hypothetical protein